MKFEKAQLDKARLFWVSAVRVAALRSLLELRHGRGNQARVV